MSKINVKNIVADMQKLYSKDKKVQSIICAGDAVKSTYTKDDYIPLPKDNVLAELQGIPGLVYNKIIMLAGETDAGKSTLAAEAMVAAQKAQVQVIIWDSEDKADTNRIKKMGGVPEELLMIKTNEILKGAELARKYITAIKEQVPESKVLLVWDGIGASQSRSHAERELDSEKHGQPGQDAKENGSVMKMIVSLINKYPDSIAVLMTNHTYDKIGFMQHGTAIPGGKKIALASSLVVKLKPIKVLTKVVKGVTTKVGILSRASVVKNHLSQGNTSVHQLDFQITASGSTLVDSSGKSEDESE